MSDSNTAKVKVTQEGIVVSDKMDKTISVQIETLVKHPVVGKYIRKRSKFMVHDEKNEGTEGDVVLISQGKPTSKNKRWFLEKVIEKKTV